MGMFVQFLRVSLENIDDVIEMIALYMMTSSNGNIFRVTGHLCGEFTGHRWIPDTKASEAEPLMFSLICAWINGWVNNCDAGDSRRHRVHHDVIVMIFVNVYQQATDRKNGVQMNMPISLTAHI